MLVRHLFCLIKFPLRVYPYETPTSNRELIDDKEFQNTKLDIERWVNEELKIWNSEENAF